jgi:hypothetical protein
MDSGFPAIAKSKPITHPGFCNAFGLAAHRNDGL